MPARSTSKDLSELKGGLPVMGDKAKNDPILRKIGITKLRLKGEDATSSRSPPYGPRLLAVADGHGGAAAALHCCTNNTRANVLDAIDMKLQMQHEAPGNSSGTNIEAACLSAFSSAHDAVRALPGEAAGTTLTVAVLDDAHERLTVANVGDSFALLGKR